jgi:aminoglycoside phosphotransferase (APT) family kinase protein
MAFSDNPSHESVWSYLRNRTRRSLLPCILERSRRLYPRMLGNVQRLNDVTILKKGKEEAIALEAEATQFVLQNTRIPVPRVYDTWSAGDGSGDAYLVMEYIPGEMLGQVWGQLSPEQRRSVLQTIGQFIQQLRTIPQTTPAGWIGSVSGKASYDAKIPSGSSFGPFPNEKSYNDWRVSTFPSEVEMKIANELNAIRQSMPNNHRIYLTHGDISLSNVLVRVDGGGPEDVAVVALLDWEQAGWRPEYWEADKLLWGMAQDSEWCALVEEILPHYADVIAREARLLSLARLPKSQPASYRPDQAS